MQTCFRTTIHVILAFLYFALVSHAHATDVKTSVLELKTISSGQVRGRNENGIQVFRGIPFAAPPIGENRWRSATEHPGWSGILDASNFGPQCLQPQRKGRPVASQSEDCLTLNVWTSANGGTKKPVMVWIHGGGYRYGSSSLPFYDGAGFAKSGVVLVSMNYRLGRFGFFAHPVINGKGSGSDGVTNFALTDQLQALKWVRQNIREFGGDPDNVTLFGESAGALSVSYLISENKAESLFDKAIIESSGAYKITPYAWQDRGRQKATMEDALTWAKSYELVDDAATASALRGLRADQVLDTKGMMQKPSVVSAAIDGVTITADISGNFAAGKQSRIPILIGANSFEGSLMDTLQIKPKLMIWATWKHKKQARNIYQTRQRGLSDREYAYELFADATFVAPSRALARDMVRAGKNAWVYSFDFRKNNDVSVSGGSSHGLEIPFVFDNLQSAPGLFSGAVGVREVKELSDRMHQYWVNFAKTGNPNQSGKNDWPMFAPGSEPTMVFHSSGERLEKQFRGEMLDLHDIMFNERLAKANQ